MKPLCERRNNWKLVKLKSSMTSKFSKAQLKFIIVIVQSKTEIIQSMQILQSAANCFRVVVLWLLLNLVRLFLCKFPKELYFWPTAFEIYLIIFLVFFINRNSRLRWYVKKLFLKISQYPQENTCVGVSF